MKFMLKGIIYIGISVSLFYSIEAFADTIYLKNGNRVSGIITGESEDSVQIKINIGATVTFSKEDIKKIERESSEEHSRIKDAWGTERTRREEDEIRKKAFEEGQRKKGLVEYKGKWLTPEERERLYVANIAKGLDKRHAETRFSYNKDRRDRSSFAGTLLDKGNWFVRETEHFSIFYRDPDQAKIISDKAEYYFEKIAYDLGYEKEIRWKKKCQVYIIEDLDRWKGYLKDIGFNPELVGGFVPNYDEKEMFLCALSEAYLAITFPHELTHLIFTHIAGTSTIPLWLNEGLANYEASVTSILNDILVKNIKEGRHILLGDLLRMTGYPEGKEKRELFYAQAEKLVEFLITQHGREKFRAFCDLILKDRSFRDALFRAYKGDFEDLEDFNIRLVEYIVK